MRSECMGCVILLREALGVLDGKRVTMVEKCTQYLQYMFDYFPLYNSS
jgi:hypothetical protein